MKIIGQGTLSQIRTNGTYAFKCTESIYEYVAIKEYVVMKYLNIVTQDCKSITYFPEVRHFEIRKRECILTMELLESPLDASIARVQHNSHLTKILSAVCILHTLNIIHGDIRLSNIMTRFDSDAIVMIDFGKAALIETLTLQKSNKKGKYVPPGFHDDIYRLGMVITELITGCKLDSRESVKSKLSLLDPPIAHLVSTMISRKISKRPCISHVLNVMGVNIPYIHSTYTSKLDLVSPVYWVHEWVVKTLNIIMVDTVTIDPIILTTLICSVTPKGDDVVMLPGNVQVMLYGVGILFLYACVRGIVSNIDTCFNIIPETFGRNRLIIFTYVLDELLTTNDVIVALFQGLTKS